MSARGQRGFVLVAVLWMLAALAALASAYSLFAVNTAASAYLPQQRLGVEAALRSALELTAYRQLAWPKAARPTSGAFSARVGAARIEVSFRAETARVDLNAATPKLLAGLFAAAGAKDADAAFLAERVVNWRTKLKPDQLREEAAIYRKEKLAYSPIGAPFDNALELALLPKMTTAMLKSVLPHVTVYSQQAAIDPLIADPTVLSAVPGLTPKIVSALKEATATRRPESTTIAAMAGPAKDFVTIDPIDALRADIAVALPGRQVTAEIVLTVADDGEEPYQILYWRDDFDSATAGG